MRLSKSIYLFIHLLLAVGFWNFAPLSFINENFVLVLIIIWSLISFLYPKPINPEINSRKYKKYFYGILLAVFISMFSANIFWNQSFAITFLGQRAIYAMISLLSLLYVQPNIKEIEKALKWITIGTIFFWIVGIVEPNLISSITEEKLDRLKNTQSTDIGFNTPGIQLVALYLYFIIQKYTQQFSAKGFMKALIIISFFIAYQNRSMLIGIITALLYSLYILKSKYKFLIITTIALGLVIGYMYTSDIWTSLLEETQLQISNPEYARWKALIYFLYEYSPNWFCYIFGNGAPYGLHSEFGKMTLDNMQHGIFASDLGLIGTWTAYGIIPLIIIYSLVLMILFKSRFPLFLKFMAIHISIVPTIFYFSKNPGIIFFSLIIYLYAYYNEYFTIGQ